MQVLSLPQQDSLVHKAILCPDTPECLIPVNLRLQATNKQRASTLATTIHTSPSNPSVSISYNVLRTGPGPSAKDTFRRTLLESLRQIWKNGATEARFIKLVDVLQRDGCALFAGLIDTSSFTGLIDDYTAIMDNSASHAFLHSFGNLIEHPNFIRNSAFNNAIIHPLLVAMMAYAMGGPVRMTNARGKDTQPISVNAQDNMLHVDNTPFREEYKILLGWERGPPKVPTGQNFTFLPGTHKGNRQVRQLSKDSPAWFTENDSLFNTNESINSLFEFQRNIIGEQDPVVIEVNYPDQPVTALFSAASLVHHRYRNKKGHPRSCVIYAFHLASDHPGALGDFTNSGVPQTMVDLLLGYQDGSESNIDTFCSLLRSTAAAIEDKIDEILNQEHTSCLISTVSLALSGRDLDCWRREVTRAPSASQLKYEDGHFLSFPESNISRDLLVDKLSSAMAFDKHGLLDLIIYQDGHEEIRKPARKSIWTLSKDHIKEVVGSWLPAVEAYNFTIRDVQDPASLQIEAQKVASNIQESFPTVHFDRESIDPHTQRVSSMHQLILDLVCKRV
ncbi:hypothetical protein NW762_011339 [Fusarium torreyae]|uniref:Uncharacterized protein n=1 Tax=Fusarium torreyae TaxID=1237075 RepID=A0A9W8RS99_9HYPO|nr:hypothetical protein NW762_011339 [Fusarium torreyae]